VPYTNVCTEEEDGFEHWSCDDCGAHARTIKLICHHKTCNPGESKQWADVYELDGIIKSEDIEIRDDGGETHDRYRVRLENDLYSMSHNATDPRLGVNQHVGTTATLFDWRIGTTDILYINLPEDVRAAIIQRINER